MVAHSLHTGCTPIKPHFMRKPPVELKLHKKKSTDDFGYIYLRVGVPGEKEYKNKSLGYKIPVSHWDNETRRVKKGFPNYQLINTDIEKQKNNIDKELIADSLDDREHTSMTINQKLHGKKRGRDFVGFFQEYLDYVNSKDKDGEGKHSKGYLLHWKTEFNRLEAYLDGSALPFSAIDSDWLEKYEMHVAKKVNTNTTLNSIFKKFKQLVDRAIARELISPSKVAGYSWPAYMPPDRSYLTHKEVEKIANLVYNGEYDHTETKRKVAAYFVIECYSGIRFSDWSRFKIETLIDDEAFKVRAKKNGEPVYLYLKHWPGLSKMLNYVRANDMKFDLSEPETNRVLKELGNKLGFDLKLTTHVGRHTCATLLGEAGWNDNQIAEVLGVTPQTVAIYRKNTRQGIKNIQEKLGGL